MILHLLIGIIDEQLLEAVQVLEVLEAVDIQQTDEPYNKAIDKS
jgi:hypothetical protein